MQKEVHHRRFCQAAANMDWEERTMRRMILMFLVCSLAAMGCVVETSSPQPPPKRNGKVDVNAPGVTVHVEKDKGVTVDVKPK